MPLHVTNFKSLEILMQFNTADRERNHQLVRCRGSPAHKRNPNRPGTRDAACRIRRGFFPFCFILHLDNARLALHNGQKLYNRKKSGRSGKLTAKKYIYQTKGGDQQ